MNGPYRALTSLTLMNCTQINRNSIETQIKYTGPRPTNLNMSIPEFALSKPETTRMQHKPEIDPTRTTLIQETRFARSKQEHSDHITATNIP